MMTKIRKITSPLRLAIAIVFIFVVLAIMQFSSLSVLGTAKEVDVDLGYDETEQYWIISTILNEKQAVKLMIHEDEYVDLGNDEIAVAQSTISIVLDPKLPFAETTASPAGIRYISNRFHLLQFKQLWTDAPIYDIHDSAWLTTTPYNVMIFEEETKIKEQHVDINYQEIKTINIPVASGVVTIDNLGMLPQGVEQPSGDLVIMLDPQQTPHINDKANVLWSVEEWNYYCANRLPIGTNWVWGDVYKYWSGYEFHDGGGGAPTGWYDIGVEHYYVPEDVIMPYVYDISFGSNYESLTLTYSDIVYSGVVTIMVPASMVDTVIIQLYMPRPEIISIKPTELPDIKEGETTEFEVTVKNDGTQGTVQISATSDNYIIQGLTPTSVVMNEGEVYSFRFKALALNTNEDVLTEVEIFVQGRGGTDSTILEGKILEVEGYTPPDPEETDRPIITDDDDDEESWWIKWLKNPFGSIPNSLMTVMVFVIIIIIGILLSKITGIASMLVKK